MYSQDRLREDYWYNMNIYDISWKKLNKNKKLFRRRRLLYFPLDINWSTDNGFSEMISLGI